MCRTVRRTTRANSTNAAPLRFRPLCRRLVGDDDRQRLRAEAAIGVAEVADRVIFLDQGSIVEEGPPREIFRNPRSDRLRLFLQTWFERNTITLDPGKTS